ncbi:unnamed protein product [Sphagnum balticum]
MRSGMATCRKDAPANQGGDVGSDQDQKVAGGDDDTFVSDSDDEGHDDEFHDSESNPLELSDSDGEFADAEFEELINSEGLQGMLQLMLQEQTDGIMTEENSDGDDYADWIKWSSDVEENRLSVCESARNVLGPVPLQQHKLDRHSVIPIILQTAQARTEEPNRKTNEGCVSGNHSESEIRWKEICERIKIDVELDERGQQQLLATLEKYKDVFAWNKGELGCCTNGEHGIDT